MTENTRTQPAITADLDAEAAAQEAPPLPSARLRALDRLVGTWAVTGGAEGTVRYAWMDGGHFLIQHVDLEQFGQSITGFEVIGHLHPFGEPVSEEIASRYYDSQGNTFDYVYELDGGTLTIWAGAQGSPAYFRGTFTDDDTVMTGDWVYPGGGGYTSTMTRR
ncbi:hypothetical protein [Brachybacterium phenoliresistens]|uniref:hypothetical protein n=1 Tax=Brachybacterium phenoliresistens TaxID=396014 RepID=UPI0031DDC990